MITCKFWTDIISYMILNTSCNCGCCTTYTMFFMLFFRFNRFCCPINIPGHPELRSSEQTIYTILTFSKSQKSKSKNARLYNFSRANLWNWRIELDNIFDITYKTRWNCEFFRRVMVLSREWLSRMRTIGLIDGLAFCSLIFARSIPCNYN